MRWLCLEQTTKYIIRHRRASRATSFLMPSLPLSSLITSACNIIHDIMYEYILGLGRNKEKSCSTNKMKRETRDFFDFRTFTIPNRSDPTRSNQHPHRSVSSNHRTWRMLMQRSSFVFCCCCSTVWWSGLVWCMVICIEDGREELWSLSYGKVWTESEG